MCRNIRVLHNFEPPANAEEIRDAALQYVRKVSGMNRPSRVNEPALEQAVERISLATSELLAQLVTNAAPKNRETEAAKARERSARRFDREGS
jgi:hypothetical protein